MQLSIFNFSTDGLTYISANVDNINTITDIYFLIMSKFKGFSNPLYSAHYQPQHKRIVEYYTLFGFPDNMRFLAFLFLP